MVRGWGRRMGTAYIAAGGPQNSPAVRSKAGGTVKSLERSKAPLNPSSSYAWSPQWRSLGGLSSTPNTLPHPKCHSALYGGSSPPGEEAPQEPRDHLLVPRTGLLLEGQEKLAVNQQRKHLPTAAPCPLPPSCLPHPRAHSPPGGEALSFQFWLLPVWSQCRLQTRRAGSRQDTQPTRAAHTQGELLNHMHLGCAAPLPEPPRAGGRAFPGLDRVSLAPAPRGLSGGAAAGCQPCRGADTGAELILPPLSSFSEAGPGCTAASNLVVGWRSETRARTT